MLLNRSAQSSKRGGEAERRGLASQELWEVVEKRKRRVKSTEIGSAQAGCRCFSLDSTFLPEGTYPTLLRGECGVELLRVVQ